MNAAVGAHCLVKRVKESNGSKIQRAIRGDVCGPASAEIWRFWLDVLSEFFTLFGSKSIYWRNS
jgi:hypothetical protein